MGVMRRQEEEEEGQPGVVIRIVRDRIVPHVAQGFRNL